MDAFWLGFMAGALVVTLPSLLGLAWLLLEAHDIARRIGLPLGRAANDH